MQNDNFVVIQGWMCNELGLSGNELLIFALIYGFSQDGESWFSGSRSYIAKTFNISNPTVDKALKSLLGKSLIIKDENSINKVPVIKYKVDLQNVQNFIGCKESLQGVKNLYRGCKETLHNNNINNKDDIYRYVQEFCVDDKELEEAFSDFLKMRKNIKKPITSERAIKMLINKLKELSADRNEWIEMLSEAVLHDWQSVYPTDRMKDQQKQKKQPKAVNFTQREESYTEIKKKLDNQEQGVSEATMEWFNDLFGDAT